MSNYTFGEAIYYYMEGIGAKPRNELKTSSASRIVSHFDYYFSSNLFNFRLSECSVTNLVLTKDVFICRSSEMATEFYEVNNGKITSRNGSRVDLNLKDFIGRKLYKINKSVKSHTEETFYKTLTGMTPKLGYLSMPLVLFGVLSPLYSNVFNSRLVHTNTNTTFMVITAFFILFVVFEYLCKKYIKYKSSDIVQKNMSSLSDYFYELFRTSKAENLAVKIRSVEQAAVFKWENLPLLYVDIGFVTLYSFCVILLLGYFSVGLLAYYSAISVVLYFVRFSSYKDLLDSMKLAGDKFSFLSSFERKRRELKFTSNNAPVGVFNGHYSKDEVNRIALESQNFTWGEVTKANTFISMVVMYFCCFLAIKAEMMQISTVIAVMIINSRLANALTAIISRLYQFKVQKHHFFESCSAIYKDMHIYDGVSIGRVHTITTKALSNEVLKKKNVPAVTQTFKSGKTYAITGANGIGKTTLLRMLAGEDLQYEGQLIVNDTSIRNISYDALSKNYAVHYASMEFLKASLKQNFEFYGINDVATVNKLLRFASPKFELDFEKFEIAEVDQLRFSNGEKQKLLLGMTLAKNPSVIILDESTSFLSANEALKTIQWIRILNEEAIVIIATHDLNIINMADECIRLVSPQVANKVTVQL